MCGSTVYELYKRTGPNGALRGWHPPNPLLGSATWEMLRLPSGENLWNEPYVLELVPTECMSVLYRIIAVLHRIFFPQTILRINCQLDTLSFPNILVSISYSEGHCPIHNRSSSQKLKLIPHNQLTLILHSSLIKCPPNVQNSILL